jgi:hypothetical protein
MYAMSVAKLQTALPTAAAAAAADNTPGSSSTMPGRHHQQQQQHQNTLILEQHVPFTVSMLLTALKPAFALRSFCPKLAIDVAGRVARCRINGMHSASIGVLDMSPISSSILQELMIIVGGQELQGTLQGLGFREVRAVLQELSKDARLQILMAGHLAATEDAEESNSRRIGH